MREWGDAAGHDVREVRGTPDGGRHDFSEIIHISNTAAGT